LSQDPCRYSSEHFTEFLIQLHLYQEAFQIKRPWKLKYAAIFYLYEKELDLSSYRLKALNYSLEHHMYHCGYHLLLKKAQEDNL